MELSNSLLVLNNNLTVLVTYITKIGVLVLTVKHWYKMELLIDSWLCLRDLLTCFRWIR